MLLIAFTAIAGAALTRWWTRVPAFRLPLASLLVAAFAAAAPTVAIDVYNAQDIHLREWGAGFPWTLVITPAQREALDWVKHRTAPDALVQPEAQLRSPATWALIPAFAERRMAAGLPISMIPLRPYRVATETVRLGIFSAYSAEDAHTMARALSIDYVYVGDVEQESYPGVVELLDRRPDLFPPAFRNAEVTVYGVAAPKGSGW